MTLERMCDIVKLSGELNVKQMDFQDQLLYMAAFSEFAKRVEPLVTKYLCEGGERGRLYEVMQMLREIGEQKAREELEAYAEEIKKQENGGGEDGC